MWEGDGEAPWQQHARTQELARLREGKEGKGGKGRVREGRGQLERRGKKRKGGEQREGNRKGELESWGRSCWPHAVDGDALIWALTRTL